MKTSMWFRIKALELMIDFVNNDSTESKDFLFDFRNSE